MRKVFLRTGILAVLALSTPMPAHAQFGKLGDAIKKKAKEVGADAVAKKDEPAKRPVTPPAAQLAITTTVLDRLTKSLNTENGNRSAYVKRQNCSESAIQSPDYMTFVMSPAGGMKKIPDNLTDAQKMAALTQMGEVMQQKQLEFLVRKCGPVVEELEGPELASAAATSGGFSVDEYALLKERVASYCEAVARGSDTPSDTRLIFAADEMATMKPRCTALLASLKRNM